MEIMSAEKLAVEVSTLFNSRKINYFCCCARVGTVKSKPPEPIGSWRGKNKIDQKLGVSGHHVTDFKRELICCSDSKIDHLC